MRDPPRGGAHGPLPKRWCSSGEQGSNTLVLRNGRPEGKLTPRRLYLQRGSMQFILLALYLNQHQVSNTSMNTLAMTCLTFALTTHANQTKSKFSI